MSKWGCWYHLSCVATIKFWFKCHCQFIIAVKQAVSFYNYSENRKKKRIIMKGLQTRRRASETTGNGSLKRPHTECGCFGQIHNITASASLWCAVNDWSLSYRWWVFYPPIPLALSLPYPSSQPPTPNIKLQTALMSATPLFPTYIKVLVKQTWWD